MEHASPQPLEGVLVTSIKKKILTKIFKKLCYMVVYSKAEAQSAQWRLGLHSAQHIWEARVCIAEVQSVRGFPPSLDSACILYKHVVYKLQCLGCNILVKVTKQRGLRMLHVFFSLLSLSQHSNIQRRSETREVDKLIICVRL